MGSLNVVLLDAPCSTAAFTSFLTAKQIEKPRLSTALATVA
jgi:hypothetical protein